MKNQLFNPFPVDGLSVAQPIEENPDGRKWARPQPPPQWRRPHLAPARVPPLPVAGPSGGSSGVPRGGVMMVDAQALGAAAARAATRIAAAGAVSEKLQQRKAARWSRGLGLGLKEAHAIAMRNLVHEIAGAEDDAAYGRCRLPQVARALAKESELVDRQPPG